MASQAAAGGSHPSLRCPECGADIRPDDARCWLCQRSLAVDAELQADQSPFPPGWVRGVESKANPWQFSLESLLLVITLVAVCLGMIMAVPGLGILVAIVAAPALLRTLIAGHQRRKVGEPMTLTEKIMAFLASTGVAIAMLASGVIAFATACFASCMVALGLENTARGSGMGRNMDWVIWAMLIFSVVVGLATAGWLFYLLRPSKMRTRPPSKGG